MQDALAFNGLDGATGHYLFTATPEQISTIALQEETDQNHLNDLKARLWANVPSLGVADTVEDVTDLAQTGWGVIFADNVDPAVRDALGELLAYRKEQATRLDEQLYQDYGGARGYHAGETKKTFLLRRDAPSSGPVDPVEMPYYLLIVGDPEAIPYSFQYQLDVQYAVGRIHFQTLDEYAQYARSVVTAERGNARARCATFFGVENPDDKATRLSANALVRPLAERLTKGQQARQAAERWDVRTVLKEEATKARLGQLLGGPDAPALLFTASHGVGFPAGDPRQFAHQGALVCQEWLGPEEWRGAIPQDHYLAADDITDDARLLGLLAFHFACYGLGTPRLNDYPQLAQVRGVDTLGLVGARPIAPQAFVARLPQRLLGHPKGGALAVIGHVERTLGSSFSWQWAGAQRSSVVPFETVLRRLLRGYPVGAALECFNERYAELCSELSDEIREINQVGKTPNPLELAGMWAASADARGFAIFGDPAVRLSMCQVE
jgi:hypothetical protein